MFNQLIGNPYFFVPFVTWALGQSLKFLINIFYGRFDFKYLIASGGMPSVHTAVVTSLTTVVAAHEGFSSPLFGSLMVLSGIVIYDSFGVRRASGEQAAVLNDLIKDLSERRELGKRYDHLRVFLGHKPIEVLVGAFLGVFMGIVMSKFPVVSNYLSFSYLFGTPKEFPLFLPLLMFFGGAVVLSILLKGYAIFKNYKAAKKKLFKWIFWWLFLGGVFGLICAAGSYEAIPVLSFPIVFIIGMLVWIYFAIIIGRYWSKKFKHEHAEYLEKERKEKYLP